LKSDEIVPIPNFSNISAEDEIRKIFREDLKRMDEQKADFIKFEVLKSFEKEKTISKF
tara:strand:- start:51960 stop:52133 length:174 start_codon:yes stop_codon:yes gene_type:complete